MLSSESFLNKANTGVLLNCPTLSASLSDVSEGLFSENSEGGTGTITKGESMLVNDAAMVRAMNSRCNRATFGPESGHFQSFM